MSNFADTVTLVNRTSRNLAVRWDGRDYLLTPGENTGFPRSWVQRAKEQNKLMGSMHPFNPADFKSLVGVLNTKDDCSPLEQSDAPQCITREFDETLGLTSKVVKAMGPTAFEASHGFAGRTGM